MLEVSKGKYVFTKGGRIYYIKEVLIQGELYKGIKATASSLARSSSHYNTERT